MKRKSSKFWKKLNEGVLLKSNARWFKEIGDILIDISNLDEKPLFLNILRRVLIFNRINNHIIKSPEEIILRSELIYELQKLIDFFKLDVKIKNNAEFIQHILKDEEVEAFHQEIPVSFHSGDNCYGASRPTPPCINFDVILWDIIKTKAEQNISYSKRSILRIFFIVALHEFSELEFNYKHCEDPRCPMGLTFPARFKENPFLRSLKACEQHHKLTKFLVHPLIRSLE
ncbi:MAG: hypothetical protein GF383_05365 [Candidatus Lokiarchaeota archaeon]|nr:hypothetical protein [Candidatus Lokiarchaeota archaeon]MBD3339325.1 hypothetical protein [Candidatus Lokiarchaeota archaeon]